VQVQVRGRRRALDVEEVRTGAEVDVQGFDAVVIDSVHAAGDLDLGRAAGRRPGDEQADTPPAVLPAQGALEVDEVNVAQVAGVHLGDGDVRSEDAPQDCRLERVLDVRGRGADRDGLRLQGLAATLDAGRDDNNARTAALLEIGDVGRELGDVLIGQRALE